MTMLTYLPIDRRLALAAGRTLPEETSGAALLADVSGFTTLTQTLVAELGQKQGAEAVLTYINPVYEELIAVLYQYRGCVIDFVGDAITCWFDETAGLPPAPLRALACGLEMQAALRPFAHQQTTQGVPFQLSIKVAVAAGPARRLLVGDPAIKLFDVVAGSTLERMAAAEGVAQRGEVVASGELLAQVGVGVGVEEWRGNTAVVTHLLTPIPPTPWPTLPPDALPAEIARPWLPPTIYDRLQSGTTSYNGDLRPVTPLMLRFSGLDFDHDPTAGQKLDSYIRRVQSIIHRYEGTLHQLTVGDKGAYLYAPFGTPIAHEDDGRRALMAALELQNPPPDQFAWLPPVQIGLTQGAIWTGLYGSSHRQAYGAMGQDVNLAARLMMSAAPGQILVSQRASQPSGFQYQHIGDIQYKGFAHPVPTYALLGRQRSERPRFDQTLVDRATQLAQLQQIAHTVATEQQLQVILLYGEAGIGKSHLSHALRHTLGDRFHWLTAQGDGVLPDALHPFIHLLKQYSHQAINADRESNKHRFQTQWAHLLEALSQIPNSEPIQTELQRTIPFLANLLQFSWPDPLYEELDAQGRYQNNLIALSTLLQAEALRHPLVLELEDAHWFDQASLELLTLLSRQLAELPCLILITARYQDDGTPPTFPLAPHTPTHTISLSTLSASGLRELAHTQLGQPIAEPLFELLWTKTGGNPFFAQQMLHYLQENDLLNEQTSAGEARTSLQTALPALPPSLDRLLVARLDRLTQQVKQVVQTAAVLGHEFELHLLSQMLQREVLAEAVQAEQQQIWQLLDELRHIFKHALLRDAAYEMQLVAQRRALHQLAATSLERVYAADLAPHYGQIAYHYEAAYQLGTAVCRQPASHYLRLAGERAADRYENHNAIEAFSRALALTNDPTAQIELLLARENVSHLLGHRPAQLADHEQLAELIDPDQQPELLLTLYVRRARYHTAVGEFHTATQLAAQATQFAHTIAHTPLLIEAEQHWARALAGQGELTAARTHYQTALQLAETTGNAPQELVALIGLSRAAAQQTEYALALAHLERALPLARDQHARRQEGDILNNLGNVALVTGDLATAQSYHEEALALRQTIGDRVGEGISWGNLGRIATQLGQKEEARRYYERQRRIVQETGNRQSEGHVLISLGLLAKGVGDFDTAVAHYHLALTLFTELGAKLGIGIACHNLGSVGKLYGAYAEAEQQQKMAVAIFSEIGDRHGAWLSWQGLGDIAVATGDLAEARRCYEEALALQQQIGKGQRQGLTLARLGDVLVMGGEWERATAVLQEALTHAAQTKQTEALQETQSALTRLHLAQGELTAAQNSFAPLLATLQDEEAMRTSTVDLRLYLTGWQLWQAVGDERAAEWLALARRVLLAQAERLTKEETRRAFLADVPWHRQIMAA